MRSARHDDRRWAARAARVASNARGHALRVSVLAPVFAAALVMLPGQVAQAAPTTQLVWLQDDAPVGVERIGQQDQAAPATLRTPLGSVWKLFVYSYLHAHGATETPYRCAAGQRKTDEEYCCDPGERIERDAALARSCGPYFEPARVGIDAQAWADYWRTQWQTQAEAQGAADAARFIDEGDGRHFAFAEPRIERPRSDAEQGCQFTRAFLAARRTLVRRGFARGHCLRIRCAAAVAALAALGLR